MSQSNNTCYLLPIPISMTVPVTEYEATFEGYIAKYGVRWIHKKNAEAINDKVNHGVTH